MTVRVVRDIFNEDFSKVIVSGDEAWATVHEYVSHVAPDLVERLSRWTSEVDVFATFRIDEQLLKALDRKVWLPSGGSLVIDKTEAMVVVDVNTGKFTGQGGNLEETVTRNNLEAAEEIVRQLRLRDLGGIVVIDFIDMVLESNRDLVMRRLLECLGRDRTKHQVAEVTSLGLVQMTRKRVGQGLLESFSETCVHCNGRGVIVHMDQATTTGGGGGKRKRRRGGSGGGEGHEHDHEAAAESVQDQEPTRRGRVRGRPARAGAHRGRRVGPGARGRRPRGGVVRQRRGGGGRRQPAPRARRTAARGPARPPRPPERPPRWTTRPSRPSWSCRSASPTWSRRPTRTCPRCRPTPRFGPGAARPARCRPPRGRRPAAAEDAAVVVVTAEPAAVAEPEPAPAVSTEPRYGPGAGPPARCRPPRGRRPRPRTLPWWS